MESYEPPAGEPEAATEPRAAALRVSGAYVLIGLGWIAASSALLSRWPLPAGASARLELLKGSLFVVLTGFLLYLLVRREVGARLAAHGALEASEARYRTLVEQSIVGVYIVQDGRFAYANPRLAEIYGYAVDELIGLPVERVAHPEDRERVRQHVERRASGRQRSVRYAARMLRKDGEMVTVDAHDTVGEYQGRAAVLGVVVDTSERMRIEQRYQQSQKLEALGTLAGGIAHDFNNLLTAIAGSADLLRVQLGRELAGEARRDLDTIRDSAERGAALTRQLLAFARSRPAHPAPLELNAAVEEFTNLLGRVLGEHIGLRLELRARPSTVVIDPSQLEQIVLNLAVNARDAMPEGGQLVIRTDRSDAEFVGWDGSSVQPPAVLLTVRDAGSGIPRDALGRVFEPFYTTKPRGKGTGLGLATVYGVVRQAGGAIRVDSEPDRGTTFRIALPAAANDVVPAGPATDEPPRTLRAAAPRRGRVLIVEDDAGVRHIAARTLRMAGYEVLEAATPAEARELAHPPGAGLDLVLCDVVLPERSGPELVRELAGERPALRVLYMSGYTPDEVRRRTISEEAVELIEKPFTPDELARRVQEVIG